MIWPMRLRGLLPIIALAAASVSCGEEPSVGVTGSPDPPDVARIRCGADGTTEVETPIVQAQANGVHIDVQVPANAELAFIVKESGGRNAEDGPFVFAVAPGEMNVACLDYEQDPGDDSIYRTVKIVDDEGVYVDGTMSCQAEGVGSSEPGGPMGSDPVQTARSILTGLRPDDDLAVVGYVERTSEASVAVLRDGMVVAVLDLEPVNGGWGWIGFSACPGSGVSY